MSLYDGPRDVTQHLKQLETRCGLGETLRDRQHGWRAERGWVQKKEINCTRPAENSGRAIAAEFGKTVFGWMRIFRKAI